MASSRDMIAAKFAPGGWYTESEVLTIAPSLSGADLSRARRYGLVRYREVLIDGSPGVPREKWTTIFEHEGGSLRAWAEQGFRRPGAGLQGPTVKERNMHPAVERFNSKVAEYAARGMDSRAAKIAVSRDYPDLHREYLKATNARAVHDLIDGRSAASGGR